MDRRFPGCEYQSYVASWLEESGQRRNVRFSCNKYGERAFDLACLARKLRLADQEKVLALYEKNSQRSKGNKTSKAAGKTKSTVKKAKKKAAPVAKVASGKAVKKKRRK
ncbi:MAG: hypothetical protein KDB03_19400 [Planctomycetales bacterium]|nr:hypothetical protein [Planctomycetales bacterium]